MRYVFNFISTVAISWPALIVGYAWASAVSGFKSGVFLHGRHEDAAIAKFVKTEGAQQ